MIPDAIAQDMQWSSSRTRQKGGQHCGMPTDLRLEHIDCGFMADVRGFRSQLQAKEFLLTVFELYLEELYGK